MKKLTKVIFLWANISYICGVNMINMKKILFGILIIAYAAAVAVEACVILPELHRLAVVLLYLSGGVISAAGLIENKSNV